MKALKIGVFILTLFGSFLIGSYIHARIIARDVIKTFDPNAHHALEYHGTSMALFGTKPLACWRVAYDATQLFAGDPVVIYVSLLGKVVKSEPNLIAKPAGIPSVDNSPHMPMP